MCNPYYKSRASYQLAEFYDEKRYELLYESYALTKHIQELTLNKTQILHSINNRIIASIRLSFYELGKFQKKYLTNVIETLIKMDEDDDKIKLIIKLKPIISIYDDLQIKILFTEALHVHTSNLTLDINQNLENGNYNEKIIDISNYIELEALFILLAQLNNIKLVINKTETIDQLWINLFKDTNNQSNIEKILKIGLHNEIFLTPQVVSNYYR
ncbi:unnamed protein product [Rotaria sp. Silwood2]|nr:unnamed protein product [Rotaria sp. Silwood2]